MELDASKRGLKKRYPFSNTLSIPLYVAFDELHLKTRIPKSKLLDEAITLLLKEHGISIIEDAKVDDK